MRPHSVGPLTQPGHLGPLLAYCARPEVAAWGDSDKEKVNSYTVELGNTNQPRIRAIQRQPPQKKMTKESLESRVGKGIESRGKSMAKSGRAECIQGIASYTVWLKHQINERGQQDLRGRERAPGAAPEGAPTGRCRAEQTR